MTEHAEALTRLTGTQNVYLGHTKNLELGILENMGTFLCENKYQISELQGLRKQIFRKTWENKGAGLNILWTFTTKRFGKWTRRHSSGQRLNF